MSNPDTNRDLRKGLGTRVACALLAGALATASFSAAAAESTVVQLDPGGERISELAVDVGRTTVVRPGFRVKRVSVGNPEVADVVVTSASEVSVVAKSTGETNVVLWDESGTPKVVLEVHVGRSRGRLESLIARHLPGEDIRVDATSGAIVLSGTASSTQALEQALELARSSPDFRSGTKGSGDQKDDVKVVNLVQVAGQHQVMLEVTIAEMSRTLSRQIGTNFNALIGDATKGVRITSFIDQLTSLSGSDVLLGDRVNLIGQAFDVGTGSAQVFLSLLETEGLSKVLAEPTLVARSGETATFLAGGEIPIPVAQGGAFGSVTVTFKSFGVSVQFTPTVLSPERIHLNVSPEVSEPDFTQGTLIEGFMIPAFLTRRASTAVDLRDGESFAIAGLLSDKTAESVARYPLLGEIPILGVLFRSSRFERKETELVLIVTPRLVAPLSAKPALPTDHFVAPNRFEFYLLGRLEGAANPAVSTASATPTADSATFAGPAGYRVTAPAEFGGEQ
jgi:pilus assembly protein CpaC